MKLATCSVEFRYRRLFIFLVALLCNGFKPDRAHCQADSTNIEWKRTCLDPKFRAEGVAIADVDRDGDIDVLAGELWYEAPAWEPHEIRPVGDYGDGAAGYSQAFLCFADDVNHDGWQDIIVIGFPGAPCHWFENPRGVERYWPQHLIWDNACNESPGYVDLFGTGQRVLLMAWHPPDQPAAGQMAWFEPGDDPNLPWQMHPISRQGTPESPVPGTQQFSHGLGIGDLNGDGRSDVICTAGWWEQPSVLVEGDPWPLHAAQLGEACSQMYADDLNHDGVADVLSSSAHNYGIWQHRGSKKGSAPIEFQTIPLFPKLMSETHALMYRDINGDGRSDMVTGKRWWAHGPNGDPGANEPAVLYWFEATAADDDETTFVPHLIDDNSGVGLHFVVDDVNDDALLDVVTSNKKGVFVFEQVRPSSVQ